MRFRWWYVFALLAVLCVAMGTWWDAGGGQTWMAVHSGTDYCVNIPPAYLTVCRAYGFWSAFGSVIPWALFSMGGIFAGLAVGLRKINCHERGCPRIGRYADAGGMFHYCGTHHPGWEGKHPSREHRLDMHHAHHAQMALLKEIHEHVTALSPQAGHFPPEKTKVPGQR
jgi:hypothetical protein